MTEEELNLAKKRFEKCQAENKRNLRLKEEALQLRQTPEVQRYLELIGFKSYQEKSEKDLIREAFKETRVNSSYSNSIWIYIGTYKSNNIREGDKMVLYNDPEASYSLYKELETENEIPVGVKCRKDFEKENTVLKPVFDELSSFTYHRKFKDIQDEYYNDLINGTASSAIQKVRK